MDPPHPASAGRVLLWGARGQAVVASRMIEDRGYEIAGVVDRDHPDPARVPYRPALYPEQIDDWVRTNGAGLLYVVAVGGAAGRERLNISRCLEDMGLQPLTLIHKSAWVDETAMVAPGSQVCAMSAVGARAQLGAQALINTHATVDHETIVGEGAHIMPGATLAGEVTVGAGATVGSNATVLPRLVVGEDSVVGAGAVVTRSVPPGVTVAGVPARTISD